VPGTVPIEELVALNDEIAALVRAGIPLELGLKELSGSTDRAVDTITKALAERMQRGASLPEALRAEKSAIPDMYRTVVEAGLRAGRLPAALEAVSNFGRELLDLRQRIGLALLYPVIVMALAYGLFVVFLVDALERFRETYELFRIEPGPFLATAVDCAAWVRDWWWAPLVILAAGFVWWMTTAGASLLDFSGPARPLRLLPGIGRIAAYFQFANFSELLALLVEHEVPLSEALLLSADATLDVAGRETARELALQVERGSTPALPSRALASLPPFLAWVLGGAGRGQGLARLLRHAATIYRRRAINLCNWFKLTFPVTAAIVFGGGATLLYALTIFGPLSSFWKTLVN
jgi:general secretion pathway protein F